MHTQPALAIKKLVMEVLFVVSGDDLICDYTVFLLLGSHVVNDFVQMPAGTVTLGKFESQFFYSWDVDYGKLQVK